MQKEPLKSFKKGNDTIRFAFLKDLIGAMWRTE